MSKLNEAIEYIKEQQGLYNTHQACVHVLKNTSLYDKSLSLYAVKYINGMRLLETAIDDLETHHDEIYTDKSEYELDMDGNLEHPDLTGLKAFFEFLKGEVK